MKKINKQQVELMFKQIDKGIVESKKWRRKQIIKNILIGVWTVTVYPFLLLWAFITHKS